MLLIAVGLGPEAAVNAATCEQRFAAAQTQPDGLTDRLPMTSLLLRTSASAANGHRQLVHRLTRGIHDLGLMRRRYGYYWAKLIGAVAVLARLGGRPSSGSATAGGSSCPAPCSAVLMTQLAFLGHDAAHRQIFKSGRWNDWISLVIANLFVGISYGWWQSKHNRHHANPNKEGADPDIALSALALTPDTATRHRSRLMRWLVAHQGWYFFPILLLEGLSLHWDGIRRVIGRDKIERRWVEMIFLTVRLGGLVALVFLVLPPGKALARSWPCSWPSSASTWASHSRRTTSACRWSPPN